MAYRSKLTLYVRIANAIQQVWPTGITLFKFPMRMGLDIKRKYVNLLVLLKKITRLCRELILKSSSNLL